MPDTRRGCCPDWQRCHCRRGISWRILDAGQRCGILLGGDEREWERAIAAVIRVSAGVQLGCGLLQ